MKAVQRTKGTKDTPTIIHAMDNYRMVGCVCNEEDTNIKWTWLCEVSFLFSSELLTDLSDARRVCPRGVSVDTGWS